MGTDHKQHAHVSELQRTVVELAGPRVPSMDYKLAVLFFIQPVDLLGHPGLWNMARKGCSDSQASTDMNMLSDIFPRRATGLQSASASHTKVQHWFRHNQR